MSSHHSQRAIDLHHKQVNEGQMRKVQRQVERFQNYLVMRRQLRMEYKFMLVCGFICFAYTSLAVAIYTGWIYKTVGITFLW